MSEKWHTGNANIDGEPRRGWIVGHFIDDPADVRTTKDVEIKWGIHPAGDERDTWVTDEYRTTVLVLISGSFRLQLAGESVLLEDQGDYVMWSAGADHSWRAEEDSVVLTVRWPSLA